MAVTSLGPFFADLADIFEAESGPNAARTSQVLRDHSARNPPAPTSGPDIDVSPLRSLDRERQHAVMSSTAFPLEHLSWRYSGLDDGRIRPEIARHMFTVELIGPTGMFPQDDIRVGLFFQSAALDYVTREHAAEETFIMLAGQGFWSCYDAPLESKTVGDIIHHPSSAPHKSVTDKSPLLAAWRWSGDIAFEKYTLTG